MYNKSTGICCANGLRFRFVLFGLLLIAILGSCEREDANERTSAIADERTTEASTDETAIPLEVVEDHDVSEGGATLEESFAVPEPTYVTIDRDAYFVDGQSNYEIFVFDDRIWAYGWGADLTETDDGMIDITSLWVSDDGIRFTNVSPEVFSQEYSAVEGNLSNSITRLSIVEFQGRLIGLGAYLEEHVLRTSEDGLTWSQTRPDFPFEPQNLPMIVVWGSRLLFIGRATAARDAAERWRSPNTIWATDDLVTWETVPTLTTPVDFFFGSPFNTNVLDDRIVALDSSGGNNPRGVHLFEGDEWRSVDLNDEVVLELLGGDFGPNRIASRRNYELLVHDDHFYVLGGVGFPTPQFGAWDTFYNLDLMTHIQVGAAGPIIFGAIPEQDVVAETYNDVWRSADGVTWEQIARPRTEEELPPMRDSGYFVYVLQEQLYGADADPMEHFYNRFFRSTYDSYQNYNRVHAVSFRGAIYLYTVPGRGGIWRSEDGVEWQKIAQVGEYITGPGREQWPPATVE